MSQYTTQLRYIVEVNSTPGKSVSARCAEAAPKIFPENWEFFDETKKLDFETAFLRHFYMQEICCETVGLWKVFLEDWLFTNMPYYNRILSALATDYDFLNAYDFVENAKNINSNKETSNETQRNTAERTSKNETGRNETTDSTRSGNSTTEDNGNGNSFSKDYDFPSSNIDAITDHITAAQSTDSTASNTNTNEFSESNNSEVTGNETTNASENSSSNADINKTSENNGNSVSEITRKGRAGVSPGTLLKEYLDALRNIYQEIFDDAESLFMGVW